MRPTLDHELPATTWGFWTWLKDVEDTLVLHRLADLVDARKVLAPFLPSYTRLPPSLCTPRHSAEPDGYY